MAVKGNKVKRGQLEETRRVCEGWRGRVARGEKEGV